MKIYDKTVEINDELKFELGCTFEEAEPMLTGSKVIRYGNSICSIKDNIVVGPFLCSIRLFFNRNSLCDFSITPERYSYAAKIAKDGENKEETMKRCAQDIIAYVEQSLVGFRRTRSNYFGMGFTNDVITAGVATDIYYDYTISFRLRDKR